ncbi:hypothetical protein [Streptomyces sp. NPDC088254]|uniref:hypothetical protein n=1 Tax=Streptomyces sp. NPDC088254 TaxID=3365847 RepID=UPI00382348E6
MRATSPEPWRAAGSWAPPLWNVASFAAIGGAGHPQFERHTIAKSFRAGAWRVFALETGFNTSADSRT